VLRPFMGLREGEIQGLISENYRDGLFTFLWAMSLTRPRLGKMRACYIGGES
jgi:hypothetical protein